MKIRVRKKKLLKEEQESILHFRENPKPQWEFRGLLRKVAKELWMQQLANDSALKNYANNVIAHLTDGSYTRALNLIAARPDVLGGLDKALSLIDLDELILDPMIDAAEKGNYDEEPRDPQECYDECIEEVGGIKDVVSDDIEDWRIRYCDFEKSECEAERRAFLWTHAWGEAKDPLWKHVYQYIMTTKLGKEKIRENRIRVKVQRRLLTESYEDISFEDARQMVELLLDAEDAEYKIKDSSYSTTYYIRDYLSRDDVADKLEEFGIPKWTGGIGYRKQKGVSWSTYSSRRNVHELTLHGKK